MAERGASDALLGAGAGRWDEMWVPAGFDDREQSECIGGHPIGSVMADGFRFRSAVRDADFAAEAIVGLMGWWA